MTQKKEVFMKMKKKQAPLMLVWYRCKSVFTDNHQAGDGGRFPSDKAKHLLTGRHTKEQK